MKFKNLLLQNHCATFNQTCTMHYWVKGIKVCSNEELFSSQKVDNGFFPLLINVIIIIWTVFSGQRCGPWPSCNEVLLVYIHVHIHVNVHIHVSRRVMSGVCSKSVHCDLSFFFRCCHSCNLIHIFIFSNAAVAYW